MRKRWLKEELAFYQKSKKSFIEEHHGEFVLIKGTEVIGFYDTAVEARLVARRRFRNVPVLIRQVLGGELSVNYPACIFGAH